MTTPYIANNSPVSVPVIGTQIFVGDLTATTAPATILGDFQKFDNMPGTEGKFVDSSRINQANVDGTVDVYRHQTPVPRVEVSDLKFTMGFNETQITAIFAMQNLKKAFMIQYGSGTKTPFIGFVQAIQPMPGDQSGEMLCSVTIKIDGALTWVPHT